MSQVWPSSQEIQGPRVAGKIPHLNIWPKKRWRASERSGEACLQVRWNCFQHQISCWAQNENFKSYQWFNPPCWNSIGVFHILLGDLSDDFSQQQPGLLHLNLRSSLLLGLNKPGDNSQDFDQPASWRRNCSDILDSNISIYFQVTHILNSEWIPFMGNSEIYPDFAQTR